MSGKLDLRALRAPLDFEASAAPAFSFIRICKPGRRVFFRTFTLPEPSEVYFVTEDVDGENYLVAPTIVSSLEGDVSPVLLVPYVTRDAQAGLWPLKRDRPGARSNSWNASAFEAAKLAEGTWIRLSTDMTMQSYNAIKAVGDLGAPQTPSETYLSLLERAFGDRVIDTSEHPVVRRLMGAE